MINPFKNKKGLGRGLSSLIGDSDVKITNNKISISSIIPNKYQPRKNFDKNSLEELTASIRERGIIQPIIVRASEDSNDKFELIAGEIAEIFRIEVSPFNRELYNSEKSDKDIIKKYAAQYNSIELGLKRYINEKYETAN